jgi:hypothetical protein
MLINHFQDLTGCGSALLAAVSIGHRNILFSGERGRMLQMEHRPRIYYTEAQKALMWDRWQKGESLHAIARLFG